MKKKELINKFIENYKEPKFLFKFVGLEIYDFEWLESAKRKAENNLSKINKLKENFNLLIKNGFEINRFITHNIDRNNNCALLYIRQKQNNNIRFDWDFETIQYLEDDNVISGEFHEKFFSLDIFEMLHFVEKWVLLRLREINERINFLNSEVEE